MLPPCNMFLCEHPVMFLFHIQVPRCFLGGGHEYHEASDMWALGCVMFQANCGPDLFKGKCDYEIVSLLP